MPLHHRIADDLPHGAHIVTSIEDDPYSPPGETQKIVVARAIRDDPLAGLFARQQIDQTQYDAGRRWQLYWDRACGSAVIAINPLKEPVDGGGVGRTEVTDRQLEAFAKLREAGRALGPEGEALACNVLADGLAIKEIARRRGQPTEMKVKYLGARFRECLETLARHWGFVNV